MPWYLVISGVVLYVFFCVRNSFRNQYVIAFLAFFLFFSLGTQRLASFKNDLDSDHLLQLTDTITAYKALISETPQQKEKTMLCQLEVYQALVNNEWVNASGYVNAYVDLEKGEKLRYGDLLFVEGQPAETSPPANPGEFNYKGYLVYNRIHHQQFIGNKFSVVGHASQNWAVQKANELRAESVAVLTSLIDDEDARAITLALVLGVKDDLQDDVIQAFSTTGSMHVLAVSGLHVGIIYAIVFLLLKRMGLSNRKYRWVLALISIAILWTYALLTGLSPSVLRAVTMFSFIAMGRALSRNSNIYNTLAASALVLLIYNPYLIMSVGFQLSYLAVFGIVYIQPKLYDLVEVNHWLLDKIWAITCVSFAAQLATAPLSMLYFHQFPSYFLLSNLFIIPAAFVILISGLVLLAVSAIPAVATAIGWLVTQFIVLVNGLVFWVSGLPGSSINGIYFSILDTWLIYALILSVTFCLVKKKVTYLKYALFISVFVAGSRVWHASKYVDTNEFSVLNVSRSQVLDFRSGFQSYLIADSSFHSDDQRQRFHLYPKRLLSGSPLQPMEDELQVEQRSNPFGLAIAFQGKQILYLNKNDIRQLDSQTSIEVDWLILGNNALRDLNQLDDLIKFDQLIIDPTNSWFTDERLTRQADSLNINHHSIRQDGYFSKQWKKDNL